MNDPLSAIDKLLAEMPDEGPPKGDEFTLYDYLEGYKRKNETNISIPGATKQLSKMVESGVLTMRKGRVNGKQGNIYRQA